MEALKHQLFNLILGKTNVCCLCFQTIEDDCFSLKDIVALNNVSLNYIEVKTAEILEYILGSECLDTLITEIICCACLSKCLECYKFLKACKENCNYINNVVESLQKLCNDTTGELVNFSTLYLTVNDQSLTGIQYYDQRTVASNCNDALLRLKIISDQNLHDISENFHDTPDNLVDNGVFKKKEKKKRCKQIDDLIEKIPISEILYDQDKTTLFKCKICKGVFSRMHNLKRHFVRVHAPKDFPCAKCNKSFGSPAILAEHRLESHSAKEAICIECGKNYASIKSLKVHELSHKLLLKCGVCGKIFKHQRRYQIHVTSKQCEHVRKKSDQERKYICDYCNKKYVCKGTLRVHIQFEHGNGCYHICAWCNKKFTSLSRLKEHTVTHTQEKNYSCEICGGCFVTKQSLLYHTRTHTGEKPYSCEQCDLRFLSTSRRAEHVRRHHMDPSLECDVCHTKFRGRSCLLRHKKRHFDPNSRLHYTKLAENEV